ncbi:MAG: TonB-dependent receptor [Gemmatimonadaceae bacterium]
MYSTQSRRTVSATLALIPMLSLALATQPLALGAQSADGVVRGRVVDENHAGVAGVTVRVEGSAASATSNSSGRYVIEHVRAGSHVLLARRPAFLPDSIQIDVHGGEITAPDIVMHSSAQLLQSLLVSASPRLNETKEQALYKQRNADNIVSVMSGDVIRSLPNANAAEAIARIPGISTERDEGEGKFVQIRGTEPRLSNVTVNGVHIPGTQTGSRVAKLDDVPTDLLGAIEVSKTLTADQDADAIGGSVNLVTKTPEGAPRGYIAGQFGQATLLSRSQSQGSAMWGGRFGDARKLGLLLGGTYDHNNRGINDIELGWDTNDAGKPIPVEWDQRDYYYNRTRYGANGALDYKFDNGSTAFLRGMWSKFNNFGNVYRFDISSGGDVASASNGVAGQATDGSLVRETSNRTPTEQLYSVSAGGKSVLGAAELSYSVNYGGTRSSSSDYHTNSFAYSGLGFTYNGANRNTPTYSYLSSADASAAIAPSNFKLTKYSANGGTTTGDDIGGQFDALFRYALGNNTSQFKVGAKYRDESRDNINYNRGFAATGTPVMLAALVGSYSDPKFYNALASGFVMGPEADHGRVTAFEYANPSMFKETTKPISDSLNNFSGGEKVASVYAMNTADFGALRVNLGLRVEQTSVNFSGNVATTPATGAQTVRRVTGTQNYSDVFPSVQLRYALSPNSNVRFAVTRGIARANYSDLAPHTSGTICDACKLRFSNVSVGNPDLKPQHAWNYDALGERYFGATGVLTFGVFYKQITDFAFKRHFIYHGPATEFDGYYATAPTNGGDAHLLGAEFDFSRHLDFLPGAWSGLGFDVNWTQVDSKAQVPADTSTTAATIGSAKIRSAPLPRQAKSIGNVALVYDAKRFSARAAWQYQGESIYSYGDGTPTPSGDNWFFPHSQIDASFTVNLTNNASLQLQGLNLNNAVFGFYNGTSAEKFANQREYYGRAIIAGIKYGFGATPGTH